MKKLVLASLITLGLTSVAVYANQASVELEHQNKTAASAEGTSSDMSAMKAAGKCNADQSPKKNVKKQEPKAKTKAELEIEHANKVKNGDDSVAGDMGNMKAEGKCGSK
ncbi:hypothetical protein MNB_SV-13-1601 [hydrothermal vent metagenome]|uniref:Uncharacterized protein n=1 Tax=hydrothermal vent metagenome TaxID=652676 RepID=A0A1W1C7T7_9ZZZZ